jgi:hypothetical protein
LWSLGGLPQTLAWDRQAGLHAGGGGPTEQFAAFCSQLRIGWRFCAPADPQAKGVVERLQDFIERGFEPGRAFANELDFQLQLDTWFAERANARHHKTLRCRPVDRLAEERDLMASLPAGAPTPIGAGCCASRQIRIPLRHKRLRTRPGAGRPGRRSSRHRACGPRRRAGHRRAGVPAPAVLARHRTVTDLAHARALKTGRAEGDLAIEIRPLARYDALIA